jgi:hypothetical protein
MLTNPDSGKKDRVKSAWRIQTPKLPNGGGFGHSLRSEALITFGATKLAVGKAILGNEAGLYDVWE